MLLQSEMKCLLCTETVTDITVLTCISVGVGVFDIRFGLQKSWEALTEKPQCKAKVTTCCIV